MEKYHSTISQKCLFITRPTFKRKIQEFFSTHRLERQYTKEEILEIISTKFILVKVLIVFKLLHTIGKDVNQLDLSECAMLAGIPRSPNYYSPLNNLGAANERKAEA